MNYLNEINLEGFVIIENVYNDNEIENIITEIEKITVNKFKNPTFRKSENLFAIRQFHKEIPETLNFIFNNNLKEIIKLNFGKNYFITKSIYFDKPKNSNWFVAYHQDLTISVNKRIEIDKFQNWTTKQSQFAVQPPKEILDNNFTVRIHLDKTTHKNGALKVFNKSHKKGIAKIESFDINKEKETICEIDKGGIMIMKPLLFHASNKTTNNKRRRVIHIEFSNQPLPNEIEWSEKINFNIYQ